MDSLEVIVLALVQAATEFLPVSSSGHLILVPALFGWAPAGIAFDVALHLGTLIAVAAYFRDDILSMIRPWWRSFRYGGKTTESAMAWGLLIATIPAAALGLIGGQLIETHLRSPAVVAFQLAVFGLLLWLVDRYARRDRATETLRLRHWLLLGLAQSLALVPGTSRSGITMTMARGLGLPREQAARVSFLMALPVIALAGGYETLGWVTDDRSVDAGAMLLGVGVAALAGYACIHGFMRLIGRIGFGIFAAYRIVLAALIVLLIY